MTGHRSTRIAVGLAVGLAPRLVVAALIAAPSIAHAYIGPARGFALVSSFLTLVIAVATACLALLIYPVRAVVRWARRGRARRAPKFRKVVILGLDGLEPTIIDRMIAAGRLPHFQQLKGRGGYWRLGTSTPALSPVAWSTFATGCDSSRHGIWDFLTRDRHSYLPKLSSSEVHGRQRSWRLGPLRIPRGGACVRSLRGSKSFWKVLDEHGVFTSVLRVPITFPPEHRRRDDSGVRAGPARTQGSFTYFTTSRETVGSAGW